MARRLRASGPLVSRPSLYLFLAEEYLHGCTFAAFGWTVPWPPGARTLYEAIYPRLVGVAIDPPRHPTLQGSALLSNWIRRNPFLPSAPVDESRRPVLPQKTRPRRRCRPVDEHCHSSCRG